MFFFVFKKLNLDHSYSTQITITKKNVYLIPTSIINVIRFSYQTNCLKNKKKRNSIKFSLIYFLNNKMLNLYL